MSSAAAQAPTTEPPTPAAASDDSEARWAAVLAQFDAATRGGTEFVAPSGAEGAALGPVPVELRALAAELLAACDARIDAVQAEMDGVDEELSTLRQAGRGPRGGRYRATGVEHTGTGIGHIA
ncbi:MAG: hypothetical protein ACYC2O_08845 [Microthrixaceae bacterium]